MAGSSQTEHARDQHENDAKTMADGQQPGGPDIDSDDLDARELAEARAAAKAEQDGGAGAGGEPAGKTSDDNKGEQAQQGAQPGGNEPAAGQEGREPQKDQHAAMIPKQRFDEVLSKAAELERTNAYLQGRLAASQGQAPQQQGGQQPSQQQKPAPTLDEMMGEIHTKQDEIAKKFDDGDVTFSEMQREMRELNKREADIREQQLLAKVPKPQYQPQQQAPQGDNLYLEQKTRELEQQHPYVEMIEDDSDFNWLVGKARTQLEGEGVRLDNTDIAKFRLRERVAQLSDQYGPMLTGKQLPQQEQQQQTGPSATAEARRQKLQMQNEMPPDLSRVPPSGGGNQGGEPGQPSDAQLETMSDDDIAALPPQVRNRMLGIAS